MPLPAPILDSRTWQQLRDELVGRIPVYAPEWTDVSPSDPGVTILELLAFLGENLLFRFNQIPEATHLELVRLLDVPLRPAQPAGGIVTFSVPFDHTKPFVLPVVEKGLVSVKAGNVGCEVQDDVSVLPVLVRAAVKEVVTEVPTGEQALAAERAIDARDGLKEGETAIYYKVTTVADDETAPTGTPVNAGASVDQSLWIAVIAPSAEAKVADALRQPDGPLGSSPLDPGRGGVLSLGFALPTDALTMAEVDPCFGAAGRDEGVPPQVEWRVTKALLGADGEPEYITIDPVGDTTWGLTREGVVRLRLPARLEEVGVPAPADPFLAGTGDFPPVLDDEPPVLFWIRAFAPPGAPLLGAFRWVGANAARVVQWRTATAEYLGTATGQPGQVYALAQRDVLADSLRVQVEQDTGQWVNWQRVESFTASTRDDTHFVLDSEAGTVTFGDTVRGLAPGLGRRIRALEYRYGGGAHGNVTAKALSAVEVDTTFGGEPVGGTVAIDRAPGGATVTNPLPTAGGADAEDVAEGLRRIPGELRRRDRAVTASDFKELALATPGGLVGRAECLPLFHRGQPFVEAAGVVTVVVWPKHDPLHPDAPVPDRGVLNSVCSFLDARRLVTTELYVVPPEYVQVAVSVGFEPKAGASPDAVRRWVEQVIRQYLSPMPPYGPEGQGWPLGRTVRAAELEAAALQVDGVLFLHDVRLSGRREDGTWVEGTVSLEKWQSVEVAGVTVVAGPGVPEPVTGIDIPPLPPDSRPVPIPVPPDVC